MKSRNRGAKNPMAKITWDDVRKIRQLDKDGLVRCYIAMRFGISRPQVNRICTMKAWIPEKEAAEYGH